MFGGDRERPKVVIGLAARQGISRPPDRFFPPDGVLAASQLDVPGWLFADLDFALLDAVRTDGQVLSLRDWEHQDGIVATVVSEGNWFVPALVAAMTGQLPAESSVVPTNGSECPPQQM